MSLRLIAESVSIDGASKFNYMDGFVVWPYMANGWYVNARGGSSLFDRFRMKRRACVVSLREVISREPTVTRSDSPRSSTCRAGDGTG